jgi:hypothetical protein
MYMLEIIFLNAYTTCLGFYLSKTSPFENNDKSMELYVGLKEVEK